MYSSQKIHFFFQKPLFLPNKKKIKETLYYFFLREKKKLLSLNYIFCSDKFLLKINQRFLNHNFFTDVITFDLSPNRNKIEGEIYISVERVKENSIKLDLDMPEEILRVMFHGALHLCGYTDIRPKQIAQMRKMETELIDFCNRFP